MTTVGLTASITGVTITNVTGPPAYQSVVFTATNSFNVGDGVTITGITPSTLNVASAQIASRTGTTFTVLLNAATVSGTFSSAGLATTFYFSETSLTDPAIPTRSITENVIDHVGLPPTVNVLYQNTNSIYDVAIGGQPYYLAASNKYPYTRETATYKRTQLDTTQAPGEQTFEGWWLRSQSSWHLGANIKYFEPLQGPDVVYRFNKSVGIDPWTPGQISLLPDVTKVLTTTSGTNIVGGIDGNNVSCVIVSDGSALKRVDSAGTVTTVNYGGSGSNILSITQDGTNYYVANATGIYKGLLTGVGTGTSIFTYPASVGTVTNVSIGWVKQRLMAGVNNYLFQVVPITSKTATAAQLYKNPTSGVYVATVTFASKHDFNVGDPITLASFATPFTTFNVSTTVASITGTTISFNIPGASVEIAYATVSAGTVVLTTNTSNPNYIHPNPSWIFTAISEGPTGVYFSGYAGIASSIIKLTLNTDGTIPTLTGAVTAADFPDDEHVISLGIYLGKFVLIGTNKGIRVGTIDSSVYGGGYITYGPLTYLQPSTAHINGFAFRDRFAYATVTEDIDGSSGLIRIDLSQQLSDGKFAWTYDLNSGVTGNCDGVAFIGETGRAAFIVDGQGLYFQHATNKVASGYLDTGAIRYNTMEKKHFKLVKIRTLSPLTGSISISTITKSGAITSISNVASDAAVDQDFSTNLISSQEQLGFRFQLNRNATDATISPIMVGYQIKALPANKRTRSLNIPIMCYDFESDRYNIQTGYEGRAWDRLSALEQVEGDGNTVTIQDFTTGEQVEGLIEKISFERVDPPDRRFKGFGGVMMVQIRTTNA
jgi:hypothetical protein